MFRSYSGVPIVVTDELWADMSGSAKAIYIVLCRLSHRCSSLQVKVDDGDACKKAGIVPRSLFSARKELVTKGLIAYKRHVYELCDPKPPATPNPEESPVGTQEEQTPKVAPGKLTLRAEGLI